MSRTARRIAPRLRSLAFGAVVLPAAALAAGSLGGCVDEDAVETHVERLEDPRTAQGAVKRLIQFYEDAMTRDKNDPAGPTVKPLLDLIVEPMTKQCTDGDLTDASRAQVIKFLADARDPRAEACYIKVLGSYKPDTNEDDVRWVVRAVTAMKIEAAADPVFQVFKTLKASKPKTSVLYRDVTDAVLALLKPAWEDELIKLLEPQIADLKDTVNLKNQAYWQITAARALGELKSAKGVKPLVKIILSPFKADIAPTAVNALIKIGKPSIQPCVDLMNNKDKELMEYSKEENLRGAQKGSDGKYPKEAQKAAENAHVGAAAIILGTIGRGDAEAPMVAAIEGADDLSRAIIARELPKLPNTAKNLEAFKAAYEKTPLSLSIPPGMGARESLLEASQTYYDAGLVPWMVKTAQEAKGEDALAVQEATLMSAMKLMKKEHIELVDSIANIKAPKPDGKGQTTLGKGFEKEYKIAKELVNACDDKLECYLSKLAEPASQAEKTQFQGIKSAYMVGILGGPEVRQKLIDMMPKLTNAAVRFVAVSIIDRHSPNGDTAVADQLQKIVDAGIAAKDKEIISANAPFKTIIYRLRARAEK